MTRVGRRGSWWGRFLLGLLVAMAFALAPARPANAAVTAVYDPATQTLTVTGDNADNTITISRNVAGQLLVNGGAVTVSGGIPTVANTALIVVTGLDGLDTITLDEARPTRASRSSSPASGSSPRVPVGSAASRRCSP